MEGPAVPAHVAVEGGVRLRPRHLRAGPHAALSRRRLGSHRGAGRPDSQRRHRRPARPRSGDVPRDPAGDGSRRRCADRSAERAGVRARRGVGQRVAHQPHRPHRAADRPRRRLDRSERPDVDLPPRGRSGAERHRLRRRDAAAVRHRQAVAAALRDPGRARRRRPAVSVPSRTADPTDHVSPQRTAIVWRSGRQRDNERAPRVFGAERDGEASSAAQPAAAR